MKRRGFLKALLAGSTAAVAAHFGVAEALVPEIKAEIGKDLRRTVVGMPGTQPWQGDNAIWWSTGHCVDQWRQELQRLDGLVMSNAEAVRRYRNSEHGRAVRQAWWDSPRGKFTRQRQNARRRGIEWQLSFEQWLEVWGDGLDQMGRGRGKLCMSRFGDVGPYAVDNVEIKGFNENCAENGLRVMTKRWS